MVFGQSCCPAAAPALRLYSFFYCLLSGWACRPRQAGAGRFLALEMGMWLNKGVETRESRTFHTQPQATAPPTLGVEGRSVPGPGADGRLPSVLSFITHAGVPLPQATQPEDMCCFFPHPQHQNLSLGSDPHHRMWYREMDLESESESEASVPKKRKEGKQKQRQRCVVEEKVNKRQSLPKHLLGWDYGERRIGSMAWAHLLSWRSGLGCFRHVESDHLL